MNEAHADSASASEPGGTVVIGVGNVFRHDDGVGEIVADRVRLALARRSGHDGDVDVVSVDGEPSRIISVWDGADLAVIVDAVSTCDEPGVVHHVELDPVGDAAAAGLLSARRTSTHGAGVAEAVELGAALGRLPRRLVVFGVEGEDFSPGEGLSPPVERAVGTLVEHVRREVSRT